MLSRFLMASALRLVPCLAIFCVATTVADGDEPRQKVSNSGLTDGVLILGFTEESTSSCKKNGSTECYGCGNAYKSPLTPTAQRRACEILGIVESLGPSVLEGSVFEPCHAEKEVRKVYLIDLCADPCDGCADDNSLCEEDLLHDDTAALFENFDAFRVEWTACPNCFAVGNEPAACEACCEAGRAGHLKRGCCESQTAEHRHVCPIATGACDECAAPQLGLAPIVPSYAPAYAGQAPPPQAVTAPAMPVAYPAPPMPPATYMLPPAQGAFFYQISAPAEVPVVGCDTKSLLRGTATQLDDMADQLEEAEEFDAADALRAQADRLRTKARGEAKPEAHQATFTSEVECEECEHEVFGDDHATALRQRLRESLEALREQHRPRKEY